ncbi:MAG: hypothetical protein BWY59_00635 [Verrucomicrobia bacterium ADurb.Bin345]|nr:MAG: hypothetical protein BWY59_00635 [Verrucomicrobia bacterium ADurb.Bin345]
MCRFFAKRPLHIGFEYAGKQLTAGGLVPPQLVIPERRQRLPAEPVRIDHFIPDRVPRSRDIATLYQEFNISGQRVSVRGRHRVIGEQIPRGGQIGGQAFELLKSVAFLVNVTAERADKTLPCQRRSEIPAFRVHDTANDRVRE